MIVNKLTLGEPDFPPTLTTIASPPKQLYWSGKHPKEWLDRPRVAVVGSRKITAYGKLVTERLVYSLARSDVVIISGLAFGVDVAAHRAALQVGALTVAVLPSELERIYPSAHAQTARQIAGQGTLISEYPEGSKVTWKSNFIARNRIISGLADTLLITEAAVNSGSLYTARFALEQGKTVMAVPGNITSPVSEGCNNLIKSGAVPVTSAEDVLFALNIRPVAKAGGVFSGSKQEKTVYELIKGGICAQEEMAAAAMLDGHQVASTLTMLELSGYIRPAGAGQWVIA